jgi:hypothetical protein
MQYEIQDYQGNVIIESVSIEELDILIAESSLDETAAESKYNYFQYDSGEDTNLVVNWSNASDIVSIKNNRIYKPIN